MLVLFVLAVLTLTVLAVLVLVDWLLLAEACCAAGSGPTRASSSRVASIPHAARPAGEDGGENRNIERRNQWQRITLWNGGERRVKERMG